MDKQEQIIDLDFAVSQLSGNKSLLVKLLVKFKDQYRNLAQQLAELNESGDIKTYKEIVHTLKGVSGNLGLNALHFAARDLETAAIEQQSLDALEEKFIHSLHATIQKIDSLADEENAESATSSENADTNSQRKLIEMLENNEFITPDKLAELINDCDISELEKQDLQIAIGDLDYAEALKIINKSS